MSIRRSRMELFVTRSGVGTGNSQMRGDGKPVFSHPFFLYGEISVNK